MKNSILFLFLLMLPVLGFAQRNILAQKVQDAKNQKAAFAKPKLFQFDSQAKSANQFKDILKDGSLLELDLNNLRSLYQSAPAALELELPNSTKRAFALELVEEKLLADDFSVVTSDAKGQSMKYKPGKFYRGIVKGDNNSIAAVTVFEDEIIGVVSTTDGGNMVLGRSDARSKSKTTKDKYVFYKENDLLIKNEFLCGASEEPVKGSKDTKPGNPNEKASKCVRAYLEADYDLVAEKGGATGATNFVTSLFNAVAAAYQAESITIYISQIFTWTTPDPYPTNSTSAVLTAFRNNRPTYNGNVAHLISRGAPTNGGIAWVDALCTSYAYGYSGISSTYNQFPTYSWSVNVIAHELGHTIGSPHTHACAWNGNNTAIDGCGPAAGANEGCNAALPAQGTMMSYCHLVNGVGINFNLGFGPQPGNKIRAEVNGAGCLTTCSSPPSSPCLTVTTSGANINCAGGTNGTATATATGGSGAYTYVWSNGATTQTISNLPAGTYTVTVSAGSNCTGTATRTVTAPAALTGTTSVTPASGGMNNGAINLTVSGGTPNYTYKWSHGPTTEDVANLAAGTYTVTITDSKGCTLARTATVTTSSTPGITLSFAVTNATSGQSNGAINLTVTSGTGPFSYAWSNGANTEDLYNVPAGTYSVTVSSSASGTKTGSATVGTNTSGGGCVALPQFQSFEGNISNWVQPTNDQMNWTLLNGPTPTAYTGPDAAAAGSYFMYTEATGNLNRAAYLESPCLDLTGVSAFTFSFSYHMYGTGTGTLRVQYSINNSPTWTTVFTKSGNQGNQWMTQTLNFTSSSVNNIRFRFYVQTGNTDLGDIAVDNVNFIKTGALTSGAAKTAIALDPKSDFSVKFNPSQNILAVVLSSDLAQSGKLEISDLNGRMKNSSNVRIVKGMNTLKLKVGDLPAGTYILTLNTNKGKTEQQITISD